MKDDIKDKIIRSARNLSNTELKSIINDITVELLDRQNKILRGDI